MTAAQPRVAIVVLGDLGRSPRMQYHALALADAGAHVDLIGYEGRPPDRAVLDHPRIRLHRLSTPLRQHAPPWLFVPAAAADIVLQAGVLGWILAAGIPRPDVVLVQNPPAFPTLPLARAATWWRGARLVIDWHNFGADLLGLKMGAAHPLVRVARAAERAFGRRADGHLCVSEAMRERLATVWSVPSASVLRDRPAKRPGRTPLAERQRLADSLSLDVDVTAPDRPAMIITSSSWTLDEDFSLLLDALVSCDAAIRRRTDLPRMLFVLTGEGRLRAAWEARVATLGLEKVRTRCLWVPAEDYPRLLGAADLGLSLHRSASGVDLPMKIADMFGAGLPVCALDYGPVLGELVRDGENGRRFSTADQLGEQICTLFAGFPARTEALDRLRAGVERLSTESWVDGWQREARTVLLGA
ncbi:MAG TPA: glycosyltransferase [Polyangia bacterium]|nr:glycosyltransferase [Polyangia bacterium]